MKISITAFILILFSIVLFGCATHEKKIMESKAKYYDQADLEKFFSMKHRASYVTKNGVKGMIYH